MKKICLTVIGLYFGILASFSQQSNSTGTDSSNYKSRKLKIDEVNLISSYYRQDGDNSAVEGGVGSEKLTDIANVLDIKLIRYDRHNRKHNFTVEAGVDHYSSASSDQIDMKANSSASSADTRIYPAISWNLENEKTGRTFGLNASFSTEFDYKSLGFGANFNQKSKDKNREFGIKAQVYLDKVCMILPEELRIGNEEAAQSRNSFSTSLSLSQVINKRLQLLFAIDVVKQQGFLGLPFHRVYFNNVALAKSELLPDNRLKFPVGMRINYFAGDKIIIRSFYRFYYDDWGLTSQTLELETSFKVTPFFSLTPFYRFYNQSAVDYFAPYKAHKITDQFYTSNYDLSKFNSNFFGAGVRFAPPKGILGIKSLSMIEIRYGHYDRSNGLNSDIISLHLRLKNFGF